MLVHFAFLILPKQADAWVLASKLHSSWVKTGVMWNPPPHLQVATRLPCEGTTYKTITDTEPAVIRRDTLLQGLGPFPSFNVK